MQNAALAACGMNAAYIPFDVHPDRLDEAISGVRALGLRGINVTIPHKTSVMALLDELDESAWAAGAVNTVKNDDGRLIGHNTDGAGLIRSLADDLAFTPNGQTVVVIGAGGAARGAVAALCRAGTRRIVIANRTGDRARELAAWMTSRYPRTELTAISLEEGMISSLPQNIGLLLNTTSLGMKGEEIPGLNLAALPAGAVVYDMIYAPPVTPLLNEAERFGFRSANGIGMLVGQGELAFHIWTGTFPPDGLMKEVLTAFLGGAQPARQLS